MFLEPGGGDESQVPRYTLENPTLTGWLVKKLISLSTPLETLDDIDPGSGMKKLVWSLINTDIILNLMVYLVFIVQSRVGLINLS